MDFKKVFLGNSLVVQWLGLGAFTAGGLGSIPGQETKMPQDVQHDQKIIIITISTGLLPRNQNTF